MPFTVSQASVEEREAACRLLVGVRPPPDRDRAAQRYRDLFAAGELDPAGLFVARDESDAIRGAMVVQAMPGALGLAWPPVAERGRDRTAIEDALVATSCDWLRARGAKVCQAFIGEHEGNCFAPLVRYGFQHIAQLIDLHRELSTVDAPDSRLTFEPLASVNRDDFAATLLATFEGSLDCPEVTGSRTDAELLEGYVDAEGSHEHWFLVKRASEHIGVALLDRECEPDSIELTYLGISPIYRGRRLGAELVKFALHYAKNAGARAMVLSVDARNEPALRLYRTHGFQASGERAVFLANWPPIS